MRKIVFCLLTACFALLIAAGAMAEDALTLFSINVRKADCHLLSWQDSLYMIDTGTKESWHAVSSVLHAEGITHLNGVVITHTDKDHAGGAALLAQSGIQIDAWYASRYYCECTEAEHPAVLAAAMMGQQVQWIGAGDELPFGTGTLKVLAPFSYNKNSQNCNSAVLMAEAAGGSMLLTGDMEFAQEAALLNSGLLTLCTVLKVAHHGDDDATSSSLLRMVQPKLAVISTNTQDEPDTPDPQLLSKLKDIGCEIAVTQQAVSGIETKIVNGLLSWQEKELLPEDTLNDSIRLTAKSIARDTITLTNQGNETVALDGWTIYSEKGKEMFVFPLGTTLQPGASLTIGSRASGAEAQLVWPEDRVWHQKKADRAILYDAWGRVVDEMD